MRNKAEERYTEAIRSYIFDRSSDFYPVLDTSSEKGSSNIEKGRRHIGKAPEGSFFINELEKCRACRSAVQVNQPSDGYLKAISE